MFKQPLRVVVAILALALAACAHTSSASTAHAPCATVEIAEVVASDSPGARQIGAVDGDAVFVSPASLATTQDVVGARPAVAEGDQVLEIDLGEAPATSLRAFSASHVGTRLAFIVNGSVRNVARILDPIRGQGIIIDPVAAPEAAALAQCLHAQH